MNLLGGLGGETDPRKSTETCATKVVFVGDTKPDWFFCSPRSLLQLGCTLRRLQQQLPTVSRVSSKAEVRLFFYVPVYVRRFKPKLSVARYMCRV